MGFKNITCKLGNMRKEADWTLYPQQTDKPNEVMIQCDKRIANISLDTGKAMLSDGKGGHQGFAKLMPLLGAKEVVVPDEIIAQLRQLLGGEPQVGIIRVL